MIVRILTIDNEHDKEVLTSPCRPIRNTTQADKDTLAIIIRDLKDTLASTPCGVGLASPQIGWPFRVFIYKETLQSEPTVAINPYAIAEIGEESELFTEACLSCPGIEKEMRRFSKINFYYYDENFNFIEKRLEGFAAIVVQHELDHLDGILIVD